MAACLSRRMSAGRWALLVVFVFAGRAARAQDAPRSAARPNQGFFGGGNANPDQHLNLTWSLFDVTDSNLTAGTGSFDPKYQQNGSYADGLATLRYKAGGATGASFGATASANSRYYPDLHDLTQVGGT